mmetsp:Transcript_9495/g.25312  ORF Transcript_9495/g.25312 Transcript_9495/m.25312 type:complete len:87 (-) Transcript_9495:26-286(-)
MKYLNRFGFDSRTVRNTRENAVGCGELVGEPDAKNGMNRTRGETEMVKPQNVRFDERVTVALIKLHSRGAGVEQLDDEHLKSPLSP